MNTGRTVAWTVVGILLLAPLAVAAAWFAGATPHGLGAATVALGCAIGWIGAGVLARSLLAGATAQKRQEEQQAQQHREALAMEVLMAQPLVKITPARAALRLGEYAYGATDAGLQPIQEAAVKAPGGRGSKKIAFRNGATPDGTLAKSTVIANGELVITDQRVIFTSEAKSFAIALDQLMAVTRYSDGFGFEDGKSSYELVTPPTPQRTAFAQALYKITQR